MYHSIKKILLFIFSRSLLFRFETYLRKINYLFYKGKQYQCNICEAKLSKFIISETGNHICPKCGSLPRNRRLWGLMHEDYFKEKSSILHFSPSRALYRKFKKNNFNLDYYPSDLSNDFISEFQFDITQIQLDNNSIDLIICYHILEHVIEDSKAIQELYRVLKSGGTCFIQTPFKTGEIYEDYSILKEANRLKHFGQKDHVRIYSATGLKERIENEGFIVELISFEEDFNNINGCFNFETLLICSKN